MLESKATGSGRAPARYIELVLLPRQGWPKSEQDRLSLMERHELMEMLGIEAQYANR